MWSNIVPFLIHWLALSGHLYSNQWRSKSHWNLLADFEQLPEDEIEEFLPQICNILIDHEPSSSPDEYAVYTHFHKLLIDKCAGCLPFGLRVCSLLKSAAQGPSSTSATGIFKSVGWGDSTTVHSSAREERLNYLHQKAEEATSHGIQLPHRTGYLRAKYYADLKFMLDSMARLGRDLKAYPPNQRNFHLRTSIGHINTLLFNRMMAKGCLDVPSTGPAQPNQHSYTNHPQTSTPGYGSRPLHGLSAKQVADACPSAAAYSLHLPLQHCREKVQRILQFVETECEVLPSKERCPYLLVAEVLEQPFTCKSDALFTHGDTQENPPSDPSVGAYEHTSTYTPRSLSESSIQNGPRDERNPHIPINHSVSSRNENSHMPITPEQSIIFSSEQLASPIDTASDTSLPRAGMEMRGGCSIIQGESSEGDRSYLQQQQTKQNYHPHQQQYLQTQQPPYHSPQHSQQRPLSSPHPMFAISKSWDEKVASIRSSSSFGKLPGWGVKSFIVKSGDDLRKEILAMQIIDICQHVFDVERLDISLHPYQIISTGHMAGLVEFIEGTMSLDKIKKSAAPALGQSVSLRDYFEFTFGAPYSRTHQKAVLNFAKSLAGYSLVTYLLQVRDRHNANLLIDADGHLVHIDYGFILGGESYSFFFQKPLVRECVGVARVYINDMDIHFITSFINPNTFCVLHV